MEKRTIYFNEKQHKYTDEFGNPYTSVTTLIGKYYHEFDVKKMARICAESGKRGNIKYMGKTAEQLIQEWDKTRDDACAKGSNTHNYLENIIKNSTNYNRLVGTNLIDGTLYTILDVLNNREIGRVDLDYFIGTGLNIKYPKVFSIIKSLVDSGYTIYSEIATYSSDYLVSGLIDILAIKDMDFLIIDWKTNRAPIRFEAGYWTKDQFGNLEEYKETNKYCKTPITHIADSVGEHYTLQLSLYDYLTEQFGLHCKGNILCHIKPISGLVGEEKEEVVTLPIKYRKDDVHKLLNHHKISKLRDKNFQYVIGDNV